MFYFGFEHLVLESLRYRLLRLEDAAVEIRLADERQCHRATELPILVFAFGGNLI